MLSLERLGKASLIDDYFEVSLFGAVIQILDDWKDLEDDLAIGHFSYVTLGSEELRDGKPPREMARILREDKGRVRDIYDTCKNLISQSQLILTGLNDPFLARIVNVTELRLDAFFREELTASTRKGWRNGYAPSLRTSS